MALTDKSSIVVPKGFYGKANVLQGFNPQTESLTRVNEQGLIESVAANVPRRDFLNGGCGELLVEPQRTNLVTYSEEFENADWIKTSRGTGQAPIVSANFGTSPDGTINADRIQLDIGAGSASGDISQVQQSLTVASGIDYSGSIYLKSNDGADYDISIDFLSTTAPSILATVTNTWQRFEVTEQSTGTSGFFRIRLRGNEGTSKTADILAFGAQFEEGSYPTSYIPTTGSAVTRNQDVISATNIGSLLNDAAGGIFVEASPFSEFENGYVGLSDGTSLNRVRFGFSNAGSIALASVVGGSVQIASTSSSYFANTFYKLGLRYANNDYAVYQDGTSIITDTNALTFPDSTLSNVVLADSVAGGTGSFYGRLRQLVIFDQAPTDAQLTSITS